MSLSERQRQREMEREREREREEKRQAAIIDATDRYLAMRPNREITEKKHD
ncbi:hypothetical protein KIPB_013958, partial [Kipferlia bialata]|eukprot:g13958.t1